MPNTENTTPPQTTGAPGSALQSAIVELRDKIPTEDWIEGKGSIIARYGDFSLWLCTDGWYVLSNTPHYLIVHGPHSSALEAVESPRASGWKIVPDGWPHQDKQNKD